MIRNKSIKIWTLITHAFVVIGMGHGILTLGIGEIFWLLKFFEKPIYIDDNHVSGSVLRLVALISLIGQILMIMSLFIKPKAIDLSLHLIGVFLLWASLLLYAYGIRNDSYSHIASITCLPFLYVTTRTLIGKYIQEVWQRLI